MKRSTTSGWHRILTAVALAAALSTGAILAWAQTTTTPPATTQANAAAQEAFRKARDLYQENKFAEANVENERALKLDPNMVDARILKKILESKLTATTGPTETTTTKTAGQVRLLKPSDITLIRLAELSPQDTQIKGKIDRKVLDAFWEEVVKKSDTLMPGDKAKWVQPSNFLQQVEWLKGENNLLYMEKIEFNSDPVVLLNFKNKFMPYVLANCATANCHASDKGGSFRLVRPAAGMPDLVFYTDFYILSQYTFNGAKMIDRDNPEKSLLLQYCLPKNLANSVHPKVDIPHRFADVNDPLFRSLVQVIKGDSNKNIPGHAKAKGYLRVDSLADGTTRCETELDAQPTYDGVAVAGGKLYVTLRNGEVVQYVGD